MRPNTKEDKKARVIVDLIERGTPTEISEINSTYALAMWGSKAVIVEDIGSEMRFLSPDAFKTWFSNKRMSVVDQVGQIRSVPLGPAWIKHPHRREYDGVEFFPNPDNAVGTPGYMNLWRGFAFEPSETGSYNIFKDHLLTNVCNEDPELFNYLFGWFAQIVQKPREKCGTAIVIKGKMGAGKSIVGETIGSLFPTHYLQVDDARYVTGQFNSHMANCLLLQAEEATWAGDKSAEGRLKGLITSSHQMIESKGFDPVKMPNYLRCIMTSNEEWVVPAGKDERRFVVLDVHPRCAQNHEYFEEMLTELNAGGRERLLHDLLKFDLTSLNLRKIPRTKALLQQKLLSLDSVDRFWHSRLTDGTSLRSSEHWDSKVKTTTLFEEYLDSSIAVGDRRRTAQAQFGERMAKFGLRKIRPSAVKAGEGRPYYYDLPTLQDARDIFEKYLGQRVNWPEVHDAPIEHEAVPI